ncbi:MAG TPA: M48 family metallopeptidase [Gaiellaceae bacterium]|nr:M48 family metallopeptidase [Gaiellaceae bacterium]HET8652617.1 M48 family metallopeptidase [Gaiellaceae bacterium]
MDSTLSSGRQIFDSGQVERARRYHRPVYLVRVVGIALGLLVLGLLAFGGPGDRLFDLVDGLPWWGEALAFSALVALVGALVATPIAFWRGYLHERRWGFSTQTVGAWAWDRVKGVVIGLVLTAVPMLGLVASPHLFPSWWPLVAAVGGAAVVFVVSFLAPVLLEPVFNRFAPLEDEELADDLRALADRAGVPVREVLVADASRRTRKHNAYVSGIGKTRRVVVWDTLLERDEPGELRLVVAHELGHRRFRHVTVWTALTMAGTALFVLGLWLLLQWDALLSAIGADGPGDPRVIPFVLFAAAVAELVVQPFALALSRRWERDADRFSLELTRDPEAYEATHRNLALSNLGDLDPPRAAYLFFFSHPSAPERLAAGRRWAERLATTSPSDRASRSAVSA